MGNGATRSFKVSMLSDIDIERVCREQSDREIPAEAFLLSNRYAGSVLGLSLEFLEEGQRLPPPGLPLAGAAFEPGWGFSQVVVGRRGDSTAAFRLPEVHHDHLTLGNVWGYRLCVVDGDQLPGVIAELAHIRYVLTRTHDLRATGPDFDVSVTDL